MPQEDFSVGDVLGFTLDCYSPTGYDPALGGSHVNPGTVRMQFRNPLGTIVTVTPSQVATGVFYGETSLDLAGVWRYRGVATGGGFQGSIEGAEPVASSTFAP